MTKSDAIQHFGGITALARALKINPAAVSQWRDDYVPLLRQYELERITCGALKAVDSEQRET